MTEYANILLAVRAEQTRRLPVAIIACSTPSSKLMALILSLRFYSQRPYCNPKPQAVAFSRLMNLPWNSIVRYQDSSEGLAEAKEKGHKDSGGGGGSGICHLPVDIFLLQGDRRCQVLDSDATSCNSISVRCQIAAILFEVGRCGSHSCWLSGPPDCSGGLVWSSDWG